MLLSSMSTLPQNTFDFASRENIVCCRYTPNSCRFVSFGKFSMVHYIILLTTVVRGRPTPQKEKMSSTSRHFCHPQQIFINYKITHSIFHIFFSCSQASNSRGNVSCSKMATFPLPPPGGRINTYNTLHSTCTPLVPFRVVRPLIRILMTKTYK